MSWTSTLPGPMYTTPLLTSAMSLLPLGVAACLRMERRRPVRRRRADAARHARAPTPPNASAASRPLRTRPARKGAQERTMPDAAVRGGAAVLCGWDHESSLHVILSSTLPRGNGDGHRLSETGHRAYRRRSARGADQQLAVLVLDPPRDRADVRHHRRIDAEAEREPTGGGQRGDPQGVALGDLGNGVHRRDAGAQDVELPARAADVGDAEREDARARRPLLGDVAQRPGDAREISPERVEQLGIVVALALGRRPADGAQPAERIRLGDVEVDEDEGVAVGDRGPP